MNERIIALEKVAEAAAVVLREYGPDPDNDEVWGEDIEWRDLRDALAALPKPDDSRHDKTGEGA